MLSMQRRNEIKTILLEKHSVTVADMAQHFGVSSETIRRDFEALEIDGFLSKTYGGAVIKQHVKSQVDYPVLKELFVENKQRIARKAAEMIHPGDCIFLDYSTTALQICNEIQDMKLTVMSNSLKVLSTLSARNNINLIATGGDFDFHSYGFFGRAAVKYLGDFHLDKAFISCKSLSMEKGLRDKEEKDSEMHRAVIENADAVYLVIDHTKFDKVSFVKTADIEEVTALITDDPLPDAWRNYLRNKKINYFECV